MARLRRISPTGVPVHLIQRGNNRQTCFATLEDYTQQGTHQIQFCKIKFLSFMTC